MFQCSESVMLIEISLGCLRSGCSLESYDGESKHTMYRIQKHQSPVKCGIEWYFIRNA